MFRSLGECQSACPHLFVLRPTTREGDLTGLFKPIRSTRKREQLSDKVGKRKIELQLYCQAPEYWRPLGHERGIDDPATGLYQIELSSAALLVIARYLPRMVKLMKYVTPAADVKAAARREGQTTGIWWAAAVHGERRPLALALRA